MHLLDFLPWYVVVKVNIKRLVTNMNFFMKESSISEMPNAQTMSIIASRIYVVILTASVLIMDAYHLPQIVVPRINP